MKGGRGGGVAVRFWPIQPAEGGGGGGLLSAFSQFSQWGVRMYVNFYYKGERGGCCCLLLADSTSGGGEGGGCAVRFWVIQPAEGIGGGRVLSGFGCFNQWGGGCCLSAFG